MGLDGDHIHGRAHLAQAARDRLDHALVVVRVDGYEDAVARLRRAVADEARRGAAHLLLLADLARVRHQVVDGHDARPVHLEERRDGRGLRRLAHRYLPSVLKKPSSSSCFTYVSSKMSAGFSGAAFAFVAATSAMTASMPFT